MTKLFIIGLGDHHVPLMAARIASAGFDAEIVPVASVDDIPIPEMERDDLVLNLGGEESIETKIAELELTMLSAKDYPELDARTMKKIERRENREFRSKKDRRNHR